jgi:hypothetical protein
MDSALELISAQIAPPAVLDRVLSKDVPVIGCSISRRVPLGDGDEKDLPGSLCENVVGSLPRCMHMITADEVIRRIDLWFTGGLLRYLALDYEPIPERFLVGIASC